MPPLISVTLSAYNVEPFLRECLECIVNQTLLDIEIICTNDGSTDGTKEILIEYATNDPRVKIINKPHNEGLAVARNEALALASGKYIGFVDGDDLLDRDLFRKAYERAEEQGSDMLLWDFVSFSSRDELREKVHSPSTLLSIDPADKVALLNRPAFAWTKLIRTAKAKALGLSFPRGLTYQDIPVHWKLVTQLENIAILPERLSYYRQQPAATTHRNGWKRADLAIIMDLVEVYLKESGLYDIYRDVYLRKQLEALCGVHDVVDVPLRPRAMELILARLGEDQLQYLMSDKQMRWQTRDFYLAMHGSIMAKMRRALWLSTRGCYRAVKPIFSRADN